MRRFICLSAILSIITSCLLFTPLQTYAFKETTHEFTQAEQKFEAGNYADVEQVYCKALEKHQEINNLAATQVYSKDTSTNTLFLSIIDWGNKFKPLAEYNNGKWRKRWITKSYIRNEKSLVSKAKPDIPEIILPKEWYYYFYKNTKQNKFSIFNPQLIDEGSDYSVGFEHDINRLKPDNQRTGYERGIALNKDIIVKHEMNVHANEIKYKEFKKLITDNFNILEADKLKQEELRHLYKEDIRKSMKLELKINQIEIDHKTNIYRFCAKRDYNKHNKFDMNSPSITNYSGWLFKDVGGGWNIINQYFVIQGWRVEKLFCDYALAHFKFGDKIFWIGVSFGYEGHSFIIIEIMKDDIEVVFNDGGGGV